MSKCEQCIVRQFNSLRAMTHEQLKMVSDNKTSKFIKKGEPIFQEGEHLTGIYCVRSGVSKLSKRTPNGRTQIVKLASQGELLGQRSVIAHEPANLTAEALDDMEVCFVSKDHILSALQNNAEFAVEVLRHMAHDLKQADEVVVHMSQKTVKQRLAATFLYLHHTFGPDQEGYLKLTLSREDIADIVGTATESAIRMISELKKEGLIQTQGKKIKVSDVGGLTKMAES
ncbi:MAG: hypothetical protein RLZZ463_361 [Bacteroidota bacterium]|jgi:CRP-like cAMP-binding protein